MPTGAAILGGAVLSSVSSSRASKAGQRAAAASAGQIAEAGRIAREDVLTFFPGAQQDLISGARGAFDIFGQGITGQQQALQQGNINAQGTISAGLPQIRAALLGLPSPGAGRAFAPQNVQLGQAPINPFPAAPAQAVDGAPAALAGGAPTSGGFAPVGTGPLTNIGSVASQLNQQRIAQQASDVDQALIGRLVRRGQGFGAQGIRSRNQLRAMGFDINGNPLTTTAGIT